jgi:hypothetical protein
MSTSINDFYLLLLFSVMRRTRRDLLLSPLSLILLLSTSHRHKEVDPAAKSPKAPKKPMKKVVTVHSSKHLKKSSDAGATLEAHQSTSSSDDVREYTGIFTSTFAC